MREISENENTPIHSPWRPVNWITFAAEQDFVLRNRFLTWQWVGVHALDCRVRDAVEEAKTTSLGQHVRKFCNKRYLLFVTLLSSGPYISSHPVKHFVNGGVIVTNREDVFDLLQFVLDGVVAIASYLDQAVNFLLEFRNPIGVKLSRRGERSLGERSLVAEMLCISEHTFFEIDVSNLITDSDL